MQQPSILLIQMRIVNFSRWALSAVRSGIAQLMACLLYTSDAADERSSVDLGGRRIIKKKKKVCIEITLQTVQQTKVAKR